MASLAECTFSISTHPMADAAHPVGALYRSQLTGSRLLAWSLAVQSAYAVTSCGVSSSSTSVELPSVTKLASSHFDHLSTLLPSMTFEASCPLTDAPPG